MRIGLSNLQQIEGTSPPTAEALRKLTSAVQTGWNKQHVGDGSHGDITATGLEVSGLSVFGKARLTYTDWEDDGVAGDHNDISTATLKDVSWLRIFPAQALGADLDITGIDATDREAGDLLLVTNVASESVGHDILFHLEDTASLADNRFMSVTASPAGPFRLHGGRGVWLVYDFYFSSVTSPPVYRWRILDQA